MSFVWCDCPRSLIYRFSYRTTESEAKNEKVPILGQSEGPILGAFSKSVK